MMAGALRRAVTIVSTALLLVGAGAIVLFSRGQRHDGPAATAVRSAFSGSARCRDCHEEFYRRWSGSQHGLAMQPFSAALARAQLTPQQRDVVVAGRRYRADLAAGRVRETSGAGAVDHPIAHVMGGKNVLFFLTPH